MHYLGSTVAAKGQGQVKGKEKEKEKKGDDSKGT